MTEFAEFTDCCMNLLIPYKPALIVRSGETDPFTGDEVYVGWIVYWANGAVTEGQYIIVDETGEFLRNGP
jgi:hypothetical protein